MGSIMKIVIVAVLMLLMATSYSLAQEREMTESEHSIIEFWKKEKYRVNTEKLLDRLNHPEKYKDDVHTLPEFQNEENEFVVSKSNVTESEVHAAINPIDSMNIVVSPISQALSSPMNAILCPVYYSKDKGVTWQKSSLATRPIQDNIMLVGGGDPVLVFDGNGKLYFSWINICLSLKPQGSQQTPDSIYAVMHYAVSEDGGVNFKFLNSMYLGKIVKTKFDLNNTSIRYMLDKQWMAADIKKSSPYYNNVYLSSMQLDISLGSPDFGVNMMVFRKPANSQEFSKTSVNVTKGMGFDFVQFGAIEVDLNGHVHLTFVAAKINQNPYLYHCVSKNGALTFSGPKAICQIRGTLAQFGGAESVVGINPSRMYPCPYLAIDKSGGIGKNNLYVTWTANGVSSNAQCGLDVYFSKSTDGGSSWSSPKVVNQHPEGQKIHAFYSSINVTRYGTLLISYYDRRHDTSTATTHYYIATSDDQGESFQELQLTSIPTDFAKIGLRNQEFGIGEYNALISSYDLVLPIWADGRTNDGNINIYMAKLRTLKTDEPPDDIVNITSNLFITNVFPNPSDDLMSIEVVLKNQENVTFEVFNLVGELIISGNLGEQSIGSHILDLNVKSLASNQYYLRLNSESGTALKKFNVAR
ncbi:MAG: hypothetical protein CVV22_06490 [Ignavibacteriae bacterium HGW-Ignavibacteriae-1]|jgi:hypothetical protein|nr:MAG: hypothetical protein CVV22_06490 [Ignavibacteriae bacterium HGW-Ignavibacteriae-1]